MTETTPVGTNLGFHDGELAVQRRAGVEQQAARLAGMLVAPDIHGGFQRFLADQEFAVITAHDQTGRLWTSPLISRRGFLDGHGQSLRVHTAPRVGDPLVDLPAPQPTGLLAIDFATRRRVRVNGTLVDASEGQLTIQAEQAYGNCPKYIQQRILHPVDSVTENGGRSSRRETLDAADMAMIRAADTCFLGSIHPSRGADASHRGGLAGFVRVASDREIWWPDYPGNDMFNSLGNLAADPTSALLFIDFSNGTVLHLSGTATTEWTPPGTPGDDGGTGRRVRFSIEQVNAGSRVAASSGPSAPSRNNPPVRD